MEEPCPPLLAPAGTLQLMPSSRRASRGAVQAGRQAAGCGPSQPADWAACEVVA